MWQLHDGVYLSLFLRFMVGVVEDMPDYPVNAESRLHHMGYVPLAGLADGFPSAFNHVLPDGDYRSILQL